MNEQSQKYKLGPAQRDEVNSLMESAQDDLESVLFQLVWQRAAKQTEIDQQALTVFDALGRVSRLEQQLATAIGALEQIRESDCMITTPKVLMAAHKQNIEIAANTLTKIRK